MGRKIMVTSYRKRSGTEIYRILSRYFLIMMIFFSGFSVAANEPKAVYYKAQGDKEYTQRHILASIQLYKKSLQVNPNYLPSLISLGKVLRETEAYPESLQYLKKAYSLNKKDIPMLYELASVLYEMKNYEASRRILNEGIQISPYNSQLNYLIAKIHILDKRLYLAESKLKKIIQSNPSHFESYITLGEIYTLQKRYDLAGSFFQKAKRIKPEEPGLFVLLAEVELKRHLVFSGNDFTEDSSSSVFSESIALLENAIGYDPYYLPANSLLGTIYAINRNCGEAVKYFENVLKINPNHRKSLYYMGYCDRKRSLEIYPRILNEDFNNEIIRFVYEWNRILDTQGKNHPDLIAKARYHYDYGKKLIFSNQLSHGIYEMRWSLFLFPDYIEPHYELFDYYRSKKDIYYMQKELFFLKEHSDDIKYTDLYEKYINYRRNLLFWKAGIKNPPELKTRNPLFIFYFLPEDPMGEYPDAGMAITETLNFAFHESSHIRILPYHENQRLYRALMEKSSLGMGGTFHPDSVSEIIQPAQVTTSHPNLNKDQFRYIVHGKYREINNGLEVNAHLLDIQTGIERGHYRFKATGKGYLRKIALFLHDKLEEDIPIEGRIIQINPAMGILVNLGTRDNLKKGDVIQVYRDRSVFSRLVITSISHDLLWAYPDNVNDIYRLRKYDAIYLKK